MQRLNENHSRQFPVGHHPPRTTVGVSQLAKGALIEIDLVAYKQPQ
jgi:enamine deaminase RidA (YjgF/YER057c/UK114 family)